MNSQEFLDWIKLQVDMLEQRVKHDDDPERDHGTEDYIYLEALKHISSGGGFAQEVATQALRTQRFIETRWYA